MNPILPDLVETGNSVFVLLVCTLSHLINSPNYLRVSCVKLNYMSHRKSALGLIGDFHIVALLCGGDRLQVV